MRGTRGRQLVGVRSTPEPDPRNGGRTHAMEGPVFPRAPSRFTCCHVTFTLAIMRIVETRNLKWNYPQSQDPGMASGGGAGAGELERSSTIKYTGNMLWLFTFIRAVLLHHV